MKNAEIYEIHSIRLAKDERTEWHLPYFWLMRHGRMANICKAHGHTISRAHIFLILSPAAARHRPKNIMQMQKMTFFAPRKNRPISIAQQQTLPRHFIFHILETRSQIKWKKKLSRNGFFAEHWYYSYTHTHSINKNDWICDVTARYVNSEDVRTVLVLGKEDFGVGVCHSMFGSAHSSISHCHRRRPLHARRPPMRTAGT